MNETEKKIKSEIKIYCDSVGKRIYFYIFQKYFYEKKVKKISEGEKKYWIKKDEKIRRT